MTYRAPVADIKSALDHAAGFASARSEGLYGDLADDVIEAVLEEAGRFASEVIAPLNTVGDRQGAALRRWLRHHAARLEGRLPRLGTSRLERPRLAGAMGRAGPAASCQRRVRGDVELGRDGVRSRAGADHGGGRCARGAWQRRTQAQLSAEARLRRVDGNDATDRAAGRLRCRRIAHQGRARRRRQLSHHRPENLHHLRRT